MNNFEHDEGKDRKGPGDTRAAEFTRLIELRYGEALVHDADTDIPAVLETMLARGSCRAFRPDRVSISLCNMLCAAALAAPTKSDLQQRDIVLLRDRQVAERLSDLIGTEAWVRDVPNIAVFCGNHRRQRQVHALQGRAFANDHLDAFFNASVDAAIALAAFVIAAEAVGLGCCAISAVRNESAAVSDLLALPDYVFPVAGLAFGYPAVSPPKVSLRLPLSATVHQDRYCEQDFETVIRRYDARRHALQPYPKQRARECFGLTEPYGWAEDKARQYALPERQDFGAFIRSKGFRLE